MTAAVATVNADASPDASQEPEPPQPTLWQNLRTFWGLYNPSQRGRVRRGFVVLTLIDLLDAVWPLVLGLGIDAVASTARHGGEGAWKILFFAGLLIVIFGYLGRLRYDMRMYFFVTSFDATRNMRQKLYGHLCTQTQAYYNRTTTGEIMSRLTNDLEAVRRFLGPGILVLIDVLLYFLFIPAIMVSKAWELTLICAIPLPLIPFLVRRMSLSVHSRFRKVQDQFAVMSERAHESISGAKVVKAFVREEHEAEKFSEECATYRGNFVEMAKVDALFHPVFSLVSGLEFFLVLFFGGRLMLSGELTIGIFTAFLFYVVKLADMMIEIGWGISLYQRATASLYRVKEILADAPDITSPETPHEPPVDAATGQPLLGDIEVRDLSFTYPGTDHPVLEEISFRLPAGKTLGIMGPVGAGKTTLLACLPRLLDPPEGSVYLGGVDVRQWDLAMLRQLIGVVPQETFLFSESIAENVSLGVPGLDMADVRQAATIAQLDGELHDFPDGYETLLGERGVNLSGGQKQRTAIARALLKKPQLLILDDCLSAVDTETESAILAGLRNVLKGCTAIITAHRVSAVMEADEILVLDESGRITERGTHESLLEMNGHYAGLYRAQQTDDDGDVATGGEVSS